MLYVHYNKFINLYILDLKYNGRIARVVGIESMLVMSYSSLVYN